MQFVWSLLQLLVLRISCIEAATADVQYIPTWDDGTFKSCNGAKLVVDGGVSLTCTYTLTDVGEAVQGLQWYEYSADTVGTQVYNSDGVSAGAVQGGTNLDGRAVGSFDGTTNTLTITGFTSTDIASYNCRVITSSGQVNEVVTITTPVVDSTVVTANALSDIAFTGYDDGETIETTGDIELEIILQNIEDDNQDVTYPCSPIVVSGPSDSCTISSTSTTSKCTITISESEYEDGDLTVEAHGKMGSSSAGTVVNGRSIEVTIKHKAGLPDWSIPVIPVIGVVVVVVVLAVGLYCCKKRNICCWKKVPYTVEVTTGDKNNAATSARVFIIMYGGKDGNRNSGKVWLEGGAFTRGHTAVFNVEVADMLSPLARIDIGHDNSGAVAGWFLDRVSVKCPSAGMEKMFRCDKWLAVDEGDGAIERTLYETTHKDKKKMDTSHKYKSSDHAN